VNHDLYSILGLPRDATDADIKKQYRRLAVLYHPDAVPHATDYEKEESAAKFREVQESYDTLGDPEARARYDKDGTTGDGSRLQKEALSNVCGLVLAVAETGGEGCDIVAAVRQQVANAKTMALNAADTARKKAALFRRQAARITRKAGGENVLSTAIENQADKMDAAARDFEASVAMQDAMMGLLADYECAASTQNKYVAIGGLTYTWTR